MDSFIKAISIFNDYGERRQVLLDRGVNIIAGKSKTGKSALLEIIDYCLCSARCTIPKGVITEFGYLYSIAMEIDTKFYIIARMRWNYATDPRPMFFSEECSDFDVTSLGLDYFSSDKKVSVMEAKTLIENALGLHTTNVSLDSGSTGKRASLRNMVSYLFQHQNLMASKFALFYRFSDYYKRKDTIEQFPVFAGIIGQEYYSLVLKLNDLKQKLRQAMRQEKADKKGQNYISHTLLPLIKNYCALLNINYDERMRLYAGESASPKSTRANMTEKQLFAFVATLPSVDDSFLLSSSGILQRYHELKEELEGLHDREREIALLIDNMTQANRSGRSLSDTLEEIQQQARYSKSVTNQYICPLCGHHCTEISEDDAKLADALKSLEGELHITAKYTADFSEELRKAGEKKSEITSQIRSIHGQLRKIEREYIASADPLKIRQNAYCAKAEIDAYVKIYRSGILRFPDEDIISLQKEINEIEKVISDYKLELRLKEAESFISDNMTTLAKSLDFESEYNPLRLHFKLVDKSFDVYQRQKDGSQIFLSEMGSGANWVSCHIALFLSFLHFFAAQKESPMPLFLFFDQPSQVYFPYDDTDITKIQSSDLEAVDRMYKSIFDEIQVIQKDTGILPQVIIVDHVNVTKLVHGEELQKFIRCNWFHNQGLI